MNPTGRVYIIMEVKRNTDPTVYAKKNKCVGGWVCIMDADGRDKLSECWAFSKQGAKKIIERYKTKEYKYNYENGYVDFYTIDECE